MIEALKLALREIANRAGVPTGSAGCWLEQRASLDWIAKRAADALANEPPETLSEYAAARNKLCDPILKSKKKLSEKVRLLCEAGYIIEAIKYVRTTNTSAGASLLSAKRYVDSIRYFYTHGFTEEKLAAAAKEELVSLLTELEARVAEARRLVDVI